MHRYTTYIHSDGVSENKSGCTTKITAQTDFASKTKEFKDFCDLATKAAFVFMEEGLHTDPESLQAFIDASKGIQNLDVAQALEDTSKILKEKIKILSVYKGL